jgi:hypothetical protein
MVIRGCINPRKSLIPRVSNKPEQDERGHEHHSSSLGHSDIDTFYHSEGSAATLFDVNRWDEKAGLRRDAVRSQVIDVLEAQEIKETGNEEG